MKKQIFIFLLLMMSVLKMPLVMGQFSPGDIGYDPAYHKIIKSNKVHQIISVVSASTVEDFIKGDTAAIFTFAENGTPLTAKIVDLSMAEGDIILGYNWLSNGKIKSITNNGFDGEPFETKFNYMEGGRLGGTSIDGEIPRRDHYLYDLNDHIIQRHGEVFQVPTDASGQPTGPAKWTPVDQDMYFWNADGTLKSAEYYSEFQLIAVVDYFYNENKSLASVYYYEDDSRSSSNGKTLFTYTKEGLPLTKEEYNGMGDLMVAYNFIIIHF